jgi:hypothetical protein
MYENSDLQTGKDQIGFARQVFAMETETIAHTVCRFSDEQLGAGILAFYLAHQRAPALF